MTEEEQGGSRDEHASLVDRVIDERYRVLEPLGVGGMGVVYRAEHLKLGRPVALKLLLVQYGQDGNLRQRFDREARTLAAMSHPNIVTVTDYGVFGEQPYLVMELLEGENLEERIGGRPLEPERSVEIARQVLRALAYAHAEGMVHRDLKPANVFLQTVPGAPAHVKILDFGLAKFVVGEKTHREGPALTRTGAVMGTPAYMAPEQAAGQAADARADVYAVGVMLFEMLAGRRPYEGSHSELLKQHLIAPIPSLSERSPGTRATPELDNLLRRAMAKERQARYADAAEMLRALEILPRPPVVAGAPSVVPAIETRAARETVPQRPGGQAGRGRTTRSALAVALVVVGIPVLLGLVGVAALLMATLGGDASDPTDPGGAGSPRASAPVHRAPDRSPSEAAARPAAGGGVRGADPWAGEVPATLAAIKRRLDAGQAVSGRDEQRLMTYARQHRDDPRSYLLLARTYLAKGWRSDALERYGLAYDADPAARNDPHMLPDLVTLSAHGTVGRPAAALLRRVYGRDAVAAIDATLDGGGLRREEAARLRRLRDSL